MPVVGSNLREVKEYVLDSYALLAYLQAEPGGQAVKRLLENALQGECSLHMCIVNLGEVLYIVEREGGLTKAQETLARVDELPIEMTAADRAVTLGAAHFKAQLPIAYADCFAASLSQLKNAPLVTGDTEFRQIRPEHGLQIEWLSG